MIIYPVHISIQKSLIKVAIYEIYDMKWGPGSFKFTFGGTMAPCAPFTRPIIIMFYYYCYYHCYYFAFICICMFLSNFMLHRVRKSMIYFNELKSKVMSSVSNKFTPQNLVQIQILFKIEPTLNKLSKSVKQF